MVALESADLFRSLRTDEVRALRQIAIEREYDPGREVFREGDPGDGVYVVKSGQVEISGMLGDEKRRVFSQIGPGGIFGEMAVIEHRPRSASAIATTTTTVYFIPRGEMLAFIERSPGLAMSLLQLISNRLRDFNRLFLHEIVQAEQLAIIGRFARSIIHDLKNPLNIIGLTADMASSTTASPAMRGEATQRIRKQVDRINELVGDILDFTQSESSSVIFAAMDYGEFVRYVFGELQPELELKQVRVQLAPPPAGLRVRMDPKRLRRVFANLCANAADFMPNGGTITVRFESDHTGVITEIEDTGPGIAPEILDRLFQTFATHGKTHGTGLGLSICKKIVEDHGGRIWARSEPTQGAVFAFALPLAE